MFFKFINKCQTEILRCAPPSSHVCDFFTFRESLFALNHIESFLSHIFCSHIDGFLMIDYLYQSALQITVGHWQLSIIWEHWLAKKNLEITKMTDCFSHTKKGVLKLPNLKHLFFLIFVIQLHLNFFKNSDTQGTCILHICVWMLN